ncbi:hypothetical protein QFZ80_001530 [Paenibacillus sp. V4I7]|nr:hypothetical protein [Paenibacillus sp. V4I7]
MTSTNMTHTLHKLYNKELFPPLNLKISNVVASFLCL